MVQAFASSHGAVLGVNTHCPVFLSHESSVQGLSSLQTFGVPAHFPPEQTSPVVQRFPSEQVLPSLAGVKTQPCAGSHESAVHELVSSHTRGVPVHCPPRQASFTVQAFPSSHGAVLSA